MDLAVVERKGNELPFTLGFPLLFRPPADGAQVFVVGTVEHKSIDLPEDDRGRSQWGLALRSKAFKATVLRFREQAGCYARALL